jgi:SAM-dependent methyltransferase
MSMSNDCPVCGGRKVRTVLLRESVPVHQNLLFQDQSAAINASRGQLDLVVCENCEFIFNRAFEESKLEYGESYENAQHYSPSFNAHLDSLVNHLVMERSVRNRHVVEVGCGRGTFLRKLVEYEGAGNVGYGFDPSYRGPLADLDGRLRFEQSFYDEKCADLPADVVVSRHVIEHVSSPLSLLRNIREALRNSPDPQIFCETPCVEWIIKNRVIWDFFYEHCSYFNARSLAHAFELAGFQVVEVQHVFGGQYLWLEAKLSGQAKIEAGRDAEFVQMAHEFGGMESELVRHWHDGIQNLATHHRTALWGAGAKGVTLANLIEPRPRLIDCIVDINPQKQGYYVPGTGHPIVAPQTLTTRGVSTAILMNPNYQEENRAILERENINVRLTETV